MDLADHDLLVWPAGGPTLLTDEDLQKTSSLVGSSPYDPSTTTQRIAGMAKEASDTEDILPSEGITAVNIWRHPDAHPLALHILLTSLYGSEWMEWEPETITLSMEKDGYAVSNRSLTKILAVWAAIKSPSPWKQWQVFHWTCLGLAGYAPNFTYLEEPEMGHLVAGYEILSNMDNSMYTTTEVDKFIAASAHYLGLTYLPEPFAMARSELEESKLRCLSCDAIHRDDDDVRCISCSSTKLEKVPYEKADLRDAVKEKYERLSKAPLAKALETLEDTPVDNQVYSLLTHWGYAKIQRKNLSDQLRMLSRELPDVQNMLR